MHFKIVEVSFASIHSVLQFLYYIHSALSEIDTTEVDN